MERTGLPEPPPWKQPAGYEPAKPGWLRLSGFTSKPELEKLNRNSIYCFVNRRLVRDRVLMHAVSEAYRNILPPTSFPVVLLFVEMPPEEVDVNVHPAKTEVRFRQASWLHDFVRDTLRNKLIVGRPAAGFLHAITAHPQHIARAGRRRLSPCRKRRRLWGNSGFQWLACHRHVRRSSRRGRLHPDCGSH